MTLKYGGVPEDESEVVIRLDKANRLAYVNSTWAEWSRKIEKRHGSPKRYQERDGVVYSAFWTVPLKAISIRSGEKKANHKTGHPVPVRSHKVPFPGKTPSASHKDT